MNEQTTKFGVGQTIEWQSQSAGTAKKKRGVIIAVLAERERISDVFKRLRRVEVKASRIKASDSAQNRRYLVQVTSQPKRAKGLFRVDYYAPVVKVIDGESNGRGRLVKGT